MIRLKYIEDKEEFFLDLEDSFLDSEYENEHVVNGRQLKLNRPKGTPTKRRNKLKKS